MKHPLSFLTGFACGMLAMYYFDDVSGRRRRALVRDKVVSAGHEAAHYATAEARNAMHRARGLLATGNLERVTRRPPETDFQLHERIRARLGRLVSHPKAVHVDVHEGLVRLSGDVLRKELDPLLEDIRGMAGVRDVQHQLQAHEHPDNIPHLQGRAEPSGVAQSPGGTPFH